MVRSRQHSAGPGGRRRTMQRVIFWILLSGLVTEIYSAKEAGSNYEATQTTANDLNKEISDDVTAFKRNPETSFADRILNSVPTSNRMSRSLPSKVENISHGNMPENDSNSESIQKSPLRPNSIFMFPYYRPGRSESEQEDKNQNTNLWAWSDLSNDDSQSDMNNNKRHGTVIPMVRFGRAVRKESEDNFKSVIPYPRFGRSVGQDVNQMNRLTDDKVENVEVIENDASEDEDEHNIEDFINNEAKNGRTKEYESNIIDNLRQTRGTGESNLDYVLPQMRFGRSILLLPFPRYDKPTEEKPPHTFVLPYPRPGRSNKFGTKLGNPNVEHLILPYPRPGRSERDTSRVLQSFNGESQGYKSPTEKVEGSVEDALYELEEKISMYADDVGFLGLKVNPVHLKPEDNNLSIKTRDKSDSNSNFMIPYPRPGKKSLTKINDRNQNSKEADKEIVEYVLPYPRPGKKSGSQQLQVKKSNADKSPDGSTENFILPYPRPGRTANHMLEENENNVDEAENFSFEELMKDFIDMDVENGFSYQTNSDLNESDYEIPVSEMHFPTYSRFKRSISIVPYSRTGRSGSVVPYPRLGRSASVVPYTRLGRSISDEQYPSSKRSNSVVPYPRFGKSTPLARSVRYESLLPYLRPGRSDIILPYPRPGRSEAIVPYPRPGRSGSIVPFPRPGRSEILIPYPRPGRSNVMVPYPRPGRADIMVPYPRPGRSNVMVPYPRPGRSNVMVPYPRTGKSNVMVPYPRTGRSNVMVPYPRPGRSDAVVPYPRTGRSDVMVPYPRPGRSNVIVPYPRPGRSHAAIPYPRPGRSEAILPYPRPGRSGVIVPYPRPGKSVSMTPYPRPGRASTEEKDLQTDDVKITYLVSTESENNQHYILPHPRIGRSKKSIQGERSVTDTNTVIPYPRLGRSLNGASPADVIDTAHKLNKHMISSAEDSVYLLPYPRPGRQVK